MKKNWPAYEYPAVKLKRHILGEYLEVKKDYDNLKAYYDAENANNLYDLHSIRLDTVKAYNGEHMDISDKLARLEQVKERQKVLLDLYMHRTEWPRERVENYIQNNIPSFIELSKYSHFKIWQDCPKEQLQKALRLKYLDGKDNIEISRLINMSRSDLESLLNKYTED